MRISVPGLAFALVVLAAACAGGGQSVVPAANPGAGNGPSGASTHARMVLYVPPAARQSARKPFYISSATQSFGVLAVPVSSSETPTPSNLQIFPVATPSPCAVASGGGYSCTLNVTAPVGTDIFYIGAFASPSPGPNAIPLSEFASGAVTVSLSPAPGATPLSFTLNGVVYSVAITVPSPDVGNTPNTQILPAGTPSATWPLGITAYDSAGNVIATDPTNVFVDPIAITLSPAGAGVSLSTSGATCSSGSASAVTISCAGDLSHVQFSYNGMTSPDPNDHVTDTFTIVNATQVASPSPSPATIKLASNVVTWPITTSGNVTYQSYLLRIASGALLYASYGPSGNIIGTFDPSTNTVSPPATIAGISEVTGIAVNAAGNVWIADSQLSINCFTSVASAESGTSPVFATPVQPLAPSEDTLDIFSIAIDNAGNLWYVGSDTGSYQTYAGYFSAASCTSPGTNPVAQYTLTGDSYDLFGGNNLGVLANASGIAYNANRSDGPTAGLYIANTADVPGTVGPFAPVLPGVTYGGGVGVDGNGAKYAAYLSDGNGTADIEIAQPLGTSMSTLVALPPTATGVYPYPDPEFVGVFSPSGAAADRLEYTDSDFEALGLVENVAASPLPILVGIPNAVEIWQPAYNAHGGEYVLYLDAGSNLNLARVIPTTTWAAPQVNLPSSCNGEGLLTVLERGDSGPFTVSATGGVTSTALPGADHDYWLEFGGATSTTVTVAAGGRSENYTFAAPIFDAPNCDLAHRRLKRSIHSPAILPHAARTPR
jgi:hypothetical protein